MNPYRIELIPSGAEPPLPAPSRVTTETDSAIIARSCHDPEHFSGLFDRHFAGIHAYLSRRLGVNLADDLAADTFLIAFDRRNRYDVTRLAAGPWLYGIASNLVARHKRTEMRRYRAIARSGASPDTGSGPEQIDARVDAAGQKKALAAALADLAERDRQVLLLVAWAELSCEEAAQALGIPAGTARSRLHRARKKVRVALEEGSPTPTEGEKP